jgi:uncharacterized phage protein (TIGR02218 family)
MPRNIPAALASHIALGGTSLCELIKVTPTVGSVLAFTNHIQNLTVDGQLYLARPGMRVSEVKSGLKMEIDTSQAQGFFQSGVITLADILKGKFRDATFERRFANYDSPGDGGYTYQSGQIGRVDVADNSFAVELRGLIQKLSQPVGRVTSRMCDVQRVGDSRCKFNLATTHYTAGTPFTQNLTVSTVTSANVFTVASGYNISYSSTWFDGGYLTWTSGNNSGYTAEIGVAQVISGLEFTLIMQPGQDIAIGDTFTATAGCDRVHTTCQNKFRNSAQPNGNLVNFRGYPDLAGAIIYKAADGILATQSI